MSSAVIIDVLEEEVAARYAGLADEAAQRVTARVLDEARLQERDNVAAVDAVTKSSSSPKMA